MFIDALKKYTPVEVNGRDLINSEKSDKNKILYKLIKLIPQNIDPITPGLESYIEEKYEKLNKNESGFISEVINFKKDIDKYVKENFRNLNIFKNIKDKKFGSLTNKEPFAKQLSNYIDHCMKIGFKGKTPEEIEEHLDSIIGLFHYLNSRLTFQIELNKKMSERLLKDLTLSIINEKKLITKLKEEAGLSYVKNMQEMMFNYDNSKEIEQLYKELKHQGSPNGIKMKVNVLCSQNTWEINKRSMEKMILP